MADDDDTEEFDEEEFDASEEDDDEADDDHQGGSADPFADDDDNDQGGSADPFADDDGDDQGGSSDPFADDDDDDDYDVSGPDEDDDDDFDFPMPGDDDDDDDDYDDMPDLGDFDPSRGGGGGFGDNLKEKLSGLGGNLSGGSIALIASGGVLLLIIVGLVTWLSLSFDEDAWEDATGKVEVVTTLGNLNSATKPATTSKSKIVAKTAEVAKKPVHKDDKKPAAKSTKQVGEDKGGIKPAKKTAKPAQKDNKSDGKDTADKTEDKKKKEEEEATASKPGEVVLAKVDPAMNEATPNGPLPVIAPDGRQAWQVYARPFKQAAEDEKTGKVALVIAGLGLSKTQTQAAIQQLPGEVTLSFAPYARGLGDWIAEARAAGHEVILELPMEPKDYPNNDPGPHTLLTSKGPTDNIDNLNWLLSRFPGYVGVTNFLGEKFTANEEAMLPILQYLKKRGLMYLDSKASRKSVGARLAKEIKMPRAYNTRFIDREASRVSIDARMFELERIAKSTGASVGIGFPFPVTLERLKAWIATLEKKKIILAPLSAVANLQTIR